MTAFTTIPDSSIDADSVIDVALMTALRDNALAIGGNDPTSPYYRGANTGATWIFTTSGTWTKPTTLDATAVIEVELWGGGGGGGGAGFGGGGGAYQCRRFLVSELSSSETVTVGAGGVNAAAGGYSQFGASALVKAYGGGYATAGGGGGGGGGLGSGGSPITSGAGSAAGDGGGVGVNTGIGGSGGMWGGGGGGSSGGATATFGGGGGTNTGTAGISKYGGAGGTNGNNGTAPGGGGGAINTTGGRGEVRVRVLK